MSEWFNCRLGKTVTIEQFTIATYAHAESYGQSYTSW